MPACSSIALRPERRLERPPTTIYHAGSCATWPERLVAVLAVQPWWLVAGRRPRQPWRQPWLAAARQRWRLVAPQLVGLPAHPGGGPAAAPPGFLGGPPSHPAGGPVALPPPGPGGTAARDPGPRNGRHLAFVLCSWGRVAAEPCSCGRPGPHPADARRGRHGLGRRRTWPRTNAARRRYPSRLSLPGTRR